MKNFRLITGTDDFRKLVSSDMLTVDPSYLFVDKTEFIKDFFECDAEVLLITRPRRWGKSLALSMLYYFLEKEVDGKPTAQLFESLKIAKYLRENPRLAKYQGKHPVILISFKDVKGNSFQEIYGGITKRISILFKNFDYLKNELNENNIKFGSLLTCQDSAKVFARYVKRSADIVDIADSLRFLSELLFKFHGKKVFILIDEYDNPINSVFDKPEIAQRLTDFFGNMFGACLKSNPYLERGLITGVLRIAKAGIFSGLNNLIEETMLDNSVFSQDYGFLEEEVFEIVSKAGLSTSDVKTWYNGYLVGKEKMYNPWSITQFIHKNGTLRPYWVDTGDTRIIKNLLIVNSQIQQKIKVANLLQNNFVELDSKLKTNVSMDDINFNSEALWSLLFHTGYLTLVEPLNWLKVQFPNDEVKQLIGEYVDNWFVENPVYSDAANAILTGNLEGFREALNVAITDPAYNARIFGGGGSAGRTPESLRAKEFMYQFLVMAELRCINAGETKDYEVIAEPQSVSFGKTRPDFLVLNHQEKFCIVGEIKITNRNEKLEEALERAMAQIAKNNYGQKYQDYGYHLIKLGMAFQGLDFEMAWSE